MSVADRRRLDHASHERFAGTRYSARPARRADATPAPACGMLALGERRRVVSLVRVHNLSVSLDGFATGEGQSLEAPFGHAGQRLLQWFFGTRTFQAMHGESGGSIGVDDALARMWGESIGVEIMGRNKFGPQRGPWEDEEWVGWWGPNPPFHTPVFVLTHHPRPSIPMEGGTTFHFLDATPQEALRRAREAAGGLDVRIGGGPSTVRAFLEADLVDFLHVVLVPIVLGRGVRVWDGLEALEERFDVESVTAPSGITHLVFTRNRQGSAVG
jgi:dihydrofolate reductase